MRANQLQLRHLTNHLGNLGHEVGRAIASHPTRHNHTIQATLSQPNIAPGQSNDSRTLGSLTRTVPFGLSVPSFNYGPYVQAFQPQPNDKHTRRIDEATHQIVQQYLPASVKTCYDAAHSSGTILPVNDFIDGFKYVVETSAGHGHEIYRAYCWHSSLGTGFITASGFLLQPNIQEREFGRHAPSLTSLDPTSVRLFYLDRCRVAHEYGMCVPAYTKNIDQKLRSLRSNAAILLQLECRSSAKVKFHNGRLSSIIISKGTRLFLRRILKPPRSNTIPMATRH